MEEPKTRERTCSICGGSMGPMTDQAYEATHSHCDDCWCDKCEKEFEEAL